VAPAVAPAVAVAAAAAGSAPSPATGRGAARDASQGIGAAPGAAADELDVSADARCEGDTAFAAAPVLLPLLAGCGTGPAPLLLEAATLFDCTAAEAPFACEAGCAAPRGRPRGGVARRLPGMSS